MTMAHTPTQPLTLKTAFYLAVKNYEESLLANPSLVEPERLQALQAKGIAVSREVAFHKTLHL